MALDLAVGIGQIEVDRLRRDLEFGEQVADDAAIGIQDFTLQCTHTQMLERDGVLVAHGLQVTSEHAGDGLHLGLGAEGTDALDFFGQDHIVVRDVRNDEGAQLAFATFTDRAGRARRLGGQQVELTGVLLDDDLAGAHRLGREQVQSLQAAIAVGDEVDGGGEAGHRESRVQKRVVHSRLQK